MSESFEIISFSWFNSWAMMFPGVLGGAVCHVFKMTGARIVEGFQYGIKIKTDEAYQLEGDVNGFMD